MPVSLRTGLSRRQPGRCNAHTNDERRSTGPAPLIHVENVDFYVAGRIGFHVRSLDAQMVPKTRAANRIDPRQSRISTTSRIIGGEVVEPWPAMAALFNDYLLRLRAALAQRSATETGRRQARSHGRHQVVESLSRRIAMPTTMSGTIVARDERHLVYEPASVKVLGVPQADCCARSTFRLRR